MVLGAREKESEKKGSNSPPGIIFLVLRIRTLHCAVLEWQHHREADGEGSRILVRLER